MKKSKAFILVLLIALFSWSTVDAQVPYCPNLGFELGNFDNWEGYTWRYKTSNPPDPGEPQMTGLPNPRRQEIMTDKNATDPYTGNALRKIPPGYKYSVRLGDAFKHDTISPDTSRCWHQSLRYNIKIDSTNALLILKFALVLENPGHSEIEEPRFKLNLFDQNGDLIDDCANYDVYASNANVKGFQAFDLPVYNRQRGWSNLTIRWRDWTTVGVNLLKYAGQTITIEFLTSDCTLGGHGGYAYFVAECRPLYITVSYCRGDTTATLKAPEGMEKYKWTDHTGTVVDTTQTLYLADPTEGEIYTCSMTSPTGCTVELQTAIARYELKTDFTATMLDCNTNQVLFNNPSSTSRGNLEFEWDFGDGNFSAERAPDYKFATSGRHTVQLIVTNPPSTCADTLIKTIDSFSPPLVGITGETTYCPGQSTWLKGYGAWNYTWSGNLNTDSIEVKSPGGEYWMVGHSSTGCVSDTIRRSVSEQPDWEFLVESSPVLCIGQAELLLKVSGADSYLWSTKETTGSIVVKTTGIYHVTGWDERGCEKSRTFDVIDSPMPEADFTTSSPFIDSRNNRLTFSIPPQTDVTYSWDMGDGSTETGSVVDHTYSITGTNSSYTISLTATTKYGCTKSTSVIIDVVPFIPNVFSPNGDGINDVFMDGFDLQIFDRNGLFLYRGNEGWDGTYQGKTVDPDTYFYLVHFSDRLGIAQTRKGFITLIR